MAGRAGVLQFQFRRMLASKTWRYAVVVGLVTMSVCFVQTCLVFWGHDVGEVPAADVAWVGNYESMQTPLFCFYLYFLMPFLAAAVFGDSLFLDVRRRYAGCVAVRSSLRSYLVSGAIAAFVGGFLVVLVPLLVSQLLAFVAFPATSGQDAYQLLLNSSAAEVDSAGWYDKTLFLGLFLNARYLLNLIFIVYDAPLGRPSGLGGVCPLALCAHESPACGGASRPRPDRVLVPASLGPGHSPVPDLLPRDSSKPHRVSHCTLVVLPGARGGAVASPCPEEGRAL